jgi:hypothetical protein
MITFNERTQSPTQMADTSAQDSTATAITTSSAVVNPYSDIDGRFVVKFSSSHFIPDLNELSDSWYASSTFVATLDGQVCVLKNDALELLDDTNYYWWLVRCIKTDEVRFLTVQLFTLTSFPHLITSLK